MESHVLFGRVRSLWPDALILAANTRDPDQGPLWGVIHAYEAIEERTKDYPWLEVGAWAFHQALSDVANANLCAGKKVVRSSAVTLAAFDTYMRINLRDDSWALERAMYDSSDGT